MRAWESKKLYRQGCKQLVKAGLFPDPKTGEWTRPEKIGVPATTVQMVRGGMKCLG